MVDELLEIQRHLRERKIELIAAWWKCQGNHNCWEWIVAEIRDLNLEIDKIDARMREESL